LDNISREEKITRLNKKKKQLLGNIRFICELFE